MADKWNTFYAGWMDAYIVARLSRTRLPDPAGGSRCVPLDLKNNKHPHLLCRLESSTSNCSEVMWSATHCLQSVMIHVSEQYPTPLENKNGISYICG